MDTMKDKEFLAEAEKAKLEIQAVSGQELQNVIKESYETSPELAEKTADLLKAK
jgi:hypothetical protein